MLIKLVSTSWKQVILRTFKKISDATNNQNIIESKVGIMRSRILDLDDEMDVIKSLMAGLEESG